MKLYSWMTLWGSMTQSLWPEENMTGGAGAGREVTEHLLSQWQDLRMAESINSVDS